MTTAEIREARISLAKGKCEYCDGIGTDLHHIVDKDGKRRKLYESVESVRWLCSECHIGKNKGTVLQHYRKEFDLWLRSQGFTDNQIREITGRKLHI